MWKSVYRSLWMYGMIYQLTTRSHSNKQGLHTHLTSSFNRIHMVVHKDNDTDAQYPKSNKKHLTKFSLSFRIRLKNVTNTRVVSIKKSKWRPPKILSSINVIRKLAKIITTNFFRTLEINQTLKQFKGYLFKKYLNLSKNNELFDVLTCLFHAWYLLFQTFLYFICIKAQNLTHTHTHTHTQEIISNHIFKITSTG